MLAQAGQSFEVLAGSATGTPGATLLRGTAGFSGRSSRRRECTCKYHGMRLQLSMLKVSNGPYAVPAAKRLVAFRRLLALPRSPSIACKGKPDNLDHLYTRISEHHTPVVDWLLETNKHSPNLTEEAIVELRGKERSLDEDADLRERVRRLRIAFANKGKIPWNVGVPHRPGMLLRATVRCCGGLLCTHSFAYVPCFAVRFSMLYIWCVSACPVNSATTCT
jgi:hypothetical protein